MRPAHLGLGARKYGIPLVIPLFLKRLSAAKPKIAVFQAGGVPNLQFYAFLCSQKSQNCNFS